MVKETPETRPAAGVGSTCSKNGSGPDHEPRRADYNTAMPPRQGGKTKGSP